MNTLPYYLFRQKLFVPIIVIGFAFAVVFAWATQGPGAALGVIASLLVIGFFAAPRILLGGYFLWAILNLKQFTIAPGMRVVDEGLLVVMLMVLVGSYALNPRRVPGLGVFMPLLLGLFTVLVASAIANQVGKKEILLYVSAYLRFLLCFLFALFFADRSDGRTFWILFLGCCGLQVALNVGWAFGINPLPNQSLGSVDFAMGTLSGCNYVAYYILALIFLLLARVLYYPETPLWKSTWIVLILVACLQLYMTFTLHAYYLLIAAGGLGAIFLLRNWTWRLIALVACLVAVFLVTVSARQFMSNTFDTDTLRMLYSSPMSRMDQMFSGVKGQAYADVFLHAPREMAYPWLGAGPGHFGSYLGLQNHYPLADRYIGYVFMSPLRSALTNSESVLNFPDTALIAIWSELGPFGFLCFWGLHLYALIRIARQVRRRQYALPLRRVLAVAFVPTMIAWLFICLLRDMLFLDFLQCGLWIWAALIWNPDPVAETDLAPATEASPAPVGPAGGTDRVA